MSSFTLPPIVVAAEGWSDSRLVRECLNGNQEAWSALVEKYKRLIYSIPIKYGLAAEDAADILQSVYLEALSQLEMLSEPRALTKWLMQMAAYKSYRCKVRPANVDPVGDQGQPGMQLGSLPAEMEKILYEAEQEQSLREAIAALPPRCLRLVQALFLVEPAVPYAEVAKLLGSAPGSIAFIRGRCLKKLRKEIESSAR